MEKAFGNSRRVSFAQAKKIAEAVWPYQEELRDKVSMTEKPEALTEVIQRETGRLLRGEKNLGLIRANLFSM